MKTAKPRRSKTSAILVATSALLFGFLGGGRVARTDAANLGAAATPSLPPSAKATVLLITAESLAPAWKPFAHWKTRAGKPTKIITVEQIRRDYQADSIQEKLRLCVRDHIENHAARWIILGGDSLPGGKGLVPGGHVTVHAQEPGGIPTDVVYLSKTNWDADGDGVFGEWQEDREAVSYPDGGVGLGRIPLRKPEDVAAFTEKIIAYESRYPTTNFAQQMIYTCTVGGAYPKVRNSWDGYVSKTWNGGEVGRFFSDETPWDKKGEPGSHPLSAENLVKLMNDKTAGKLHIHGHGHLPAWVLERSAFTAEHVAGLKNDGAYPLITTVSCNTGEYDSRTDPSIVELMLRQPKGGSVAVVAPIRTGKPHFHKRSDFRLMVTEGKLDGTTQTMTRYWCNGLGGGLTTGEALMKAKSQMVADALKSPGYHLCICELNLLGDPTLDMRAKTPRTPTLKSPKRIGLGNQTVEVVTNAPGCAVCLWKGKEVYAVAKADDRGQASLKIAPSSAGVVLVTASGPSLNTALDEITVSAAK
ncbi:MAG: C25 family cysteine peptidase [Planctomycetales bacterium]